MTVKVFFFAWTCVLVTMHKVSGYQCPSQRGSYNVADPDTKTGYYRCVNGVATLQYCATGTYFSADSASCVGVPSAPGVNCNDGGFFQKPNPYDCTKFYKCDHGVPISFDCPGGTHYNPSLNVCDWPQNAGCVAKQIPTTNYKPTNNNNNNNNYNTQQNNQKPSSTNNNNNNNDEPVICPVYIKPGNTRLVPNPFDETGETYYYCDSEGGVYMRFCPDGTRFNTGLSRCNGGGSNQKQQQQQQQQSQSYHW